MKSIHNRIKNAFNAPDRASLPSWMIETLPEQLLDVEMTLWLLHRFEATERMIRSMEPPSMVRMIRTSKKAIPMSQRSR